MAKSYQNNQQTNQDQNTQFAPPNWENTVENQLAEIKIWEVCPDYSNIGELSRDFIG